MKKPQEEIVAYCSRITGTALITQGLLSKLTQSCGRADIVLEATGCAWERLGADVRAVSFCSLEFSMEYFFLLPFSHSLSLSLPLHEGNRRKVKTSPGRGRNKINA